MLLALGAAQAHLHQLVGADGLADAAQRAGVVVLAVQVAVAHVRVGVERPAPRGRARASRTPAPHPRRPCARRPSVTTNFPASTCSPTISSIALRHRLRACALQAPPPAACVCPTRYGSTPIPMSYNSMFGRGFDDRARPFPRAHPPRSGRVVRHGQHDHARPLVVAVLSVEPCEVPGG